MILTEVFEYPFTRLDPVFGDHVDPPSVAIYETLLTKGATGRPTRRGLRPPRPKRSGRN